MQREWETKEVRDQFTEELKSAKSVKEITKLLLLLDVGFCSPTALKYKEGKFESEIEEVESDQNSLNQSDDNLEGADGQAKKSSEDKNIHRTKLQFLKYWPS